MIPKVTSASAACTSDLPVFIETSLAKALVCELIIVSEIQAVLDQRSTGISIIADTIPSNPWIQ
jgi:hypothetical protein